MAPDSHGKRDPGCFGPPTSPSAPNHIDHGPRRQAVLAVLTWGAGILPAPEVNPRGGPKIFGLRRFKMCLLVGGGYDGLTGCGASKCCPPASLSRQPTGRLPAHGPARVWSADASLQNPDRFSLPEPIGIVLPDRFKLGDTSPYERRRQMAELEVAVRYKTTPAKIGFALMTVSMPLWSIIVPFCLGLFLTKVLTTAGSLPMIPIIAVLGALSLIPVIAIAITAICEDDRIVITREGLSFPLFMMPLLRFRRERHWTDLASADLNLEDGLSNGKTRGLLSLHFRSGGNSTVQIAKIDKSELEQMMLALEVWGVKCSRAAGLIEFQNSLQNENRGVDHVSYTQMWEEELSRRFSATSFVPLEPNHLLLDGRLKIVRQLAFGGLSAIYLAQERGTELVIVKEAVVPHNADGDSRAKAAELFDREARLLMQLNHPHIAKVLDHFSDAGRNYLLLQYVRGQDLRQLVKQHGAQTEACVLDWSLQIANILDYLHSQSPPIIHRDLTPDNLVRREDGQIVLIDFGAANEFVGTATGTLVGKQAYIAPEQLRGKATLASDIYALGGTMYFLLTGQDPEALMASSPKEIKPEIGSAIDKLVELCTQMEESDRPDAVALCQQLESLKAKAASSVGTAS